MLRPWKSLVCTALGALGITCVSASAAEPGRSYLVILSEPPAARLGGSGAAASEGRARAGSQRERVRRAMVALENRHRAATGQRAAADADVVRREYRQVLNGFAVRLSGETAAELGKNPDVRRVVAPPPLQLHLDVSVPLVGATALWSDFAYRGAGQRIAIIDTGVDYTHPALGGCFGPGCKVVGGYDFADDDGDPMDEIGHGTHVASIAAGTGILPGVAPDAQILAYKIFGRGDPEAGVFYIDLLAAIDRAVEDGATVANMSVGAFFGSELDVASEAVDNASAAGLLSVVSAGNAYYYGTVGSPAAARTALAVGATDDSDRLASFSSRGPTLIDWLAKPEIVAPGVDICAARFDSWLPDAVCLGNDYISISGTSMSSPHVAGAAALLRGLYPSLTPEEIKSMLMHGAKSRNELGPDPFSGGILDVTTAGAGRLDVRRSADVQTILHPAPVNLGRDSTPAATWHAAAQLELANRAAVARSYSLTSEGFPAGVSVSVSPNPALVPAGGSVSLDLEVSVDNNQVADSHVPPYLHGGRLVAQAGSESTSIDVAFAKFTPPANDDCENATLISTNTFSDSLEPAGATTQVSDPVYPGAASDPYCANCLEPTYSDSDYNQHFNSVWYRFTPPTNGLITLTPVGQGFSGLGVFTGFCNALTQIGCGVYSTVSVPVSAAQAIYIELTNMCWEPFIPMGFSFEFQQAPACCGDCDGNGRVTESEKQICSDIILGSQPLSSCPSCDCNLDGNVVASELGRVQHAITNGCPGTVHACCGDCNGDGSVSDAELALCNSIVTGGNPLSVCPACDCNSTGDVVASEIGRINLNHADGCPGCCGDCNLDGMVSNGERLLCEKIAMGEAPLGSCPACDCDATVPVDTSDVARVIANQGQGCPGLPVPACSSYGALTTPNLRITRNDDPAGDERILLKGAFQGTLAPPIDPAQFGAAFVIRDQTSLPLFWRELSWEGWTANATRSRWSYRDASGDLRAIVWDDSASVPFHYRFKVTGRRSFFQVPPGSLPLRAEVVLRTGGADQCSETTLNATGGAAPSCTFTANGKTLRCR